MSNLYFSKKIHLFGILTFLLLFSGFSVFAQQVITEHATLNENKNYKPNFDESSYTKVLDENGDKVFLKNQSLTQNTEGENARANVTLTINFNFDESLYINPSVVLFNGTGYMNTWSYYDLPDPFVVNVPTGTYDIITEFLPIDDPDKRRVIIKEQQSIQENTTLQINSADAINYFSTTVYDENGGILQADPGNGSYIFFFRSFYFNPMNTVMFGEYYIFVQDADWNFYINNVSSRYSVIETLMGSSFPQGSYFSKFETITGIDGPVSIENNPVAWSYHTEMFQPTQVADDPLAPAYATATTFNGNLLNSWALGAGGVINPGDAPFRAYINNPLDGDPVDLLVIPAVIDRFVPYSPTTGGVEYLTKGNPVYSDGAGGIFYGSGDESFNSHSDPNYAVLPFLGDDYFVLDNSQIKLLPFHPRFSFDNTNTPSVVLGNNVPITVTGFKGNKFKTSNRGRYGETRESDYLATQIVVKQNGNVVFSGSYEDFETYNLPGGEIEIVLTTANTFVDGLQGTNTTTISYTGGESDAPPTLQHLQFRDSDEQVTSIFDSNVGATVRLAAGDFKYKTIPTGGGYYDYEEGNNVALSYSVYNQNDWTELGLTEYPEYFQMPAFGDYYEASLGGITNADDNVWYDLKVICTDAGGNKQEQIISPAFKVNHSLGIENIVKSNFVVYPNPFSEQLNIQLPENVIGSYSFKVTDLLGRTLYSKIQSEKSFSWNSSFLSNGVFILSIENNGMKISKKVIKM